MYEGNNPIALQSRKWLVDTLLTLMKTTPYDKITIRDLCKHADLSRQTFYNLFQSKDEILYYRLEQIRTVPLEEISESENIAVRDMLEQFTLAMEQNAGFLQILVDHGQEGIIAASISRRVSACFQKLMSKQSENRGFPYAVALLSGALFQLLMLRFEQGVEISTDDTLEAMIRIFSGDYFGFQK